MMRSRAFLVSRGLVLTFLLGLSVVGCGPATGKVSGKVSYQDKPLANGSITFLVGDKPQVQATINSDGTYTADVPVGDAKVIVTSIDEAEALKYGEALKGGRKKRGENPTAMPVGPKGPPKNLSKIPTKYNSAETSTLTATIKTGLNKDVNFNLTD